MHRMKENAHLIIKKNSGLIVNGPMNSDIGTYI